MTTEPRTVRIPTVTMADLVHCDHDRADKSGPYSPSWLGLRFVGMQSGEGYGPDLEMRECGHCGSCLAVKVSR